MRGLSEKSVIVTGGGNGIGAAVAVRFGEAGAHVAVWDIDTEAAENVAAGIRDAGGQAAAIRCDITDYDAVGAAVAETETQLGQVDVLVNNAGWDVFRPFLKTEPELWEQIIAINLRGVLREHIVGILVKRVAAVGLVLGVQPPRQPEGVDPSTLV